MQECKFKINNVIDDRNRHLLAGSKAKVEFKDGNLGASFQWRPFFTNPNKCSLEAAFSFAHDDSKFSVKMKDKGDIGLKFRQKVNLVPSLLNMTLEYKTDKK